ncbi:hypothetical protein TNCV_937521 [Trichonephila clavipes]|nr:hypothetical protein TNCV_937521 [Trichonephila clavipes]
MVWGPKMRKRKTTMLRGPKEKVQEALIRGPLRNSYASDFKGLFVNILRQWSPTGGPRTTGVNEALTLSIDKNIIKPYSSDEENRYHEGINDVSCNY